MVYAPNGSGSSASDKFIALTLVGVLFLLGFGISTWSNSVQTKQGLNSLSNSINKPSNSLFVVENSINRNVSALSSSIGSLASEVNNIHPTCTSGGGDFPSVNANLTSLNANVISMPSIILNYTHTLQAIYLNKGIAGGQLIHINVSNYTIGASGYYFGVLLGGFANHVNFSANHTVTIAITSYQQFANMATNHSYSTLSSFTGSNETFWYNTTSDCLPRIYTISSASPFRLRINATAVYLTSNTPTNGIC